MSPKKNQFPARLFYTRLATRKYYEVVVILLQSRNSNEKWNCGSISPKKLYHKQLIEVAK